MISTALEQKIKYLIKHNYQINHSHIGWWVDGLCGYLVSGYYSTRKEAVLEAYSRIQKAIKTKEHPVWFFN